MLQILTGGSSTLHFHSLHLSDGRLDGSSVLPEGESSPVLQVPSSVFAVVLPVLGLQVPGTFLSSRQHPCHCGFLLSFLGLPPKKRKRNPIAVQDQGTHAELTHAQRSAAQAQAQAHHSLSHASVWAGACWVPFTLFFLFPCLLWLFGRILFFSFLHHPILPSAKPSTLLLTYSLTRSLARSIARFCFASLPYPVFQVVSINILLLLR